MNITALRPRFIAYLEPVAEIFIRLGLTPNQISLLSVVFGLACAASFFGHQFFLGSLLLFVSAILDLVDGSVARKMNSQSRFGAVVDWIADKYVDCLALLGIGLSGLPVITRFFVLPPIADWGVAGIAIMGSMLNTFIKPVVYAEIGYKERIGGKIEDPLEGIGFFGRPETILVLVLGGLTGYIWISVILIAICTNLSALQRIVYLHHTL
ncbi:MAG: CDP-alcohol phosphatidyltransferase family protein [Methanomicrobiales archaeon]|nr:CDP-alcohol phosphatidyltransferase family protein [Methanomicrobiales archaeon]